MSTPFNERVTAKARFEGLECYPELYEKLCEGVAPENLADWLRDEKFECLDIKRNSLVRALYRYRDSLPPRALVKRPPNHIARKIAHLKTGLDAVIELEKLYLVQMERLSAAVELEEKLKFPNSKLWRDVAVAAGMLDKLLLHKREMGLSVPAGREGSESTITAVATMPPEKRERLQAVSGALLDTLRGLLRPAPAQEGAGDEAVDVDFEVVTEPGAEADVAAPGKPLESL